MFFFRCDIYFDYNLINLKEFNLLVEFENVEVEEFLKIEEILKKISWFLKEIENLEVFVNWRVVW